MNTPAHVLIGAAAAARTGDARRALAGGLGGLVPDLPLYLLSIDALVLRSIPPDTVFGALYFSPGWQRIFAIDHAAPLWGGLLALALIRRWALAAAFGLGGLLHVLADFLTHREDARPHFWPLSDWVFRSPVSYWDPAHHGRAVGAVETALAVALAVWLWRQLPGLRARGAVVLLLGAEMAPALLWALLLG